MNPISSELEESIISEQDLVTACSAQTSCELNGETVILNLNHGVYYGLEGVGARIWQLLREPRTVREILEILNAEYDVDPQVCAREVAELLRDLRQKELIEVCREASL